MSKQRIVVTIVTKSEIHWYPEDFDGSDETWEEFRDKMILDSDYREEVVMDNISEVEEAIHDGNYQIESTKLEVEEIESEEG